MGSYQLLAQLDHKTWNKVSGGSEYSYPMGYAIQVLRYNAALTEIDFALEFDAEGSFCQRHRHLADTTVLVLSGEQHLDDLHPDGTVSHRLRGAGEYHHSAGADELGHMERGGATGAVVFYSCRASDGVLFEFLDDDLQVTRSVTVADMVRSWEQFVSG